MSAHKDHFTWKAYAANGVVLTFLMILTVAASYVEMGILNFPIAIAIAMTKVTFILLIFMNVAKSSALARLFAGAGFFWFLILIAFTFADFSPLAEAARADTVPIP